MAEQPLEAMPESRSVQVKLTTTSLVYQPLVPSVPLVMAQVMVGGTVSSRMGPKEVVA